MLNRLRGVVFLTAFSAVSIQQSASTTAAQNPPALTQPVNDFAHIIDDQSRAELDRRIRALQQTTGDVLVVATVPTYQPYADIDEYAVKMFENEEINGLIHIGTEKKSSFDLARRTRDVEPISLDDIEVRLPRDTSLDTRKWTSLAL